MNRNMVVAEWNRARESLRAAQALTQDGLYATQSRELIMPFYMPLRPDSTFMTWRLKVIRRSADVRSASRKTREIEPK
jgi:hypothetical protein